MNNTTHDMETPETIVKTDFYASECNGGYCDYLATRYTIVFKGEIDAVLDSHPAWAKYSRESIALDIVSRRHHGPCQHETRPFNGSASMAYTQDMLNDMFHAA